MSLRRLPHCAVLNEVIVSHQGASTVQVFAVSSVLGPAEVERRQAGHVARLASIVCMHPSKAKVPRAVGASCKNAFIFLFRECGDAEKILQGPSAATWFAAYG
jgi:hypothetical protein